MPLIHWLQLAMTDGIELDAMKWLTLFLIQVAMFPTVALGDELTYPNLGRIASEGSKATASQAEEWEAHLREHPDDILVRIKLLGFYSGTNPEDMNATSRREQHILWMIENTPENAFLIDYRTWIRNARRAAAQDMLNLWRRHLAREPDNPRIIYNAAFHFREHDRNIAIALLKRGKAIEPKDSRWPSSLAGVYMHGIRHQMPDVQVEWATAAVRELELANKLATQDWHRVVSLPDLAEMALLAGDYEKAANAARKFQAAAQRKDGIYAAYMRRTHIVLGTVAFRSGNMDKAADHLIASASIPESFGVTVHGPDFALARDLLAAGKGEAVLDYLEQCKLLWPDGAAVLDKWQREIRAGVAPSLDPMDRFRSDISQ